MVGYPGTTGLATVDYRLTDAHFDPPGRASWYSEESYRLPDCWCCFRPLGFSQPVKADRGGPICFGSLNSPRKLNEPILRLWAKVLQRVESSRLLVLSTEQDQRQLILRIFGEEGISPNRIAFTESRIRLEYLRLYDLIDIVLDTLPYNGITTTCDALWMGVPVVSLIGNTAAGRAGLSLLSTVGLPELVGNYPARFVEIAVEFAPGSSPPDRVAGRPAPADGSFSAYGCKEIYAKHGIGISLDVAAMVRKAGGCAFTGRCCRCRDRDRSKA